MVKIRSTKVKILLDQNVFIQYLLDQNSLQKHKQKDFFNNIKTDFYMLKSNPSQLYLKLRNTHFYNYLTIVILVVDSLQLPLVLEVLYLSDHHHY